MFYKQHAFNSCIAVTMQWITLSFAKTKV